MEDESKIDPVLERQLDELFRKHGSALVITANRFLRNRSDAEDAVGNIFLKLSETVPPPTYFVNDPPAYLHQAVANEARNILRNRGFRQETDREIGNLKPRSSGMPSRPSQEMSRLLMEAKAELDLGLVALLTLHYEMDLSCKEIAERLGRTRAGIVMSITRARRQMKKIMEEKMADRPTLKELKPNAGETQ